VFEGDRAGECLRETGRGGGEWAVANRESRGGRELSAFSVVRAVVRAHRLVAAAPLLELAADLQPIAQL
jgi:hypothetical protein